MRLSDALGNTTLLITIGASFLIPLSIALYKLVHAVRILFENNLKQRKAFQKAAASRKSAPAVPTFVRHDDIVRLTEEQQKQKNHAEELIRLGKPKEAALIYRQLTLDRKAIQTLEDAGLVKEACDILLEKNVPNRAGILYSRKGYHPEAGQCFLMAKRFSDAGNAFSKAANRNYQFFHNAAEAYILAAQFSEAIACYESLLDWKKSVELCLQEKNHIRLFSLLESFVSHSRISQRACRNLSNRAERVVQQSQKRPRHGSCRSQMGRGFPHCSDASKNAKRQTSSSLLS